MVYIAAVSVSQTIKRGRMEVRPSVALDPGEKLKAYNENRLKTYRPMYTSYYFIYIFRTTYFQSQYASY